MKKTNKNSGTCVLSSFLIVERLCGVRMQYCRFSFQSFATFTTVFSITLRFTSSMKTWEAIRNIPKHSVQLY